TVGERTGASEVNNRRCVDVVVELLVVRSGDRTSKFAEPCELREVRRLRSDSRCEPNVRFGGRHRLKSDDALGDVVIAKPARDLVWSTGASKCREEIPEAPLVVEEPASPQPRDHVVEKRREWSPLFFKPRDHEPPQALVVDPKTALPSKVDQDRSEV